MKKCRLNGKHKSKYKQKCLGWVFIRQRGCVLKDIGKKLTAGDVGRRGRPGEGSAGYPLAAFGRLGCKGTLYVSRESVLLTVPPFGGSARFSANLPLSFLSFPFLHSLSLLW